MKRSFVDMKFSIVIHTLLMVAVTPFGARAADFEQQTPFFSSEAVLKNDSFTSPLDLNTITDSADPELDLQDQPTEALSGSLPPMNRQEVTSRIDQIMRIKHRNFSGSILLMQNENIIYENSFGYIDHANGIKYQNDNPFLLASASKQFTAVIILKLAQKGFISLDESVSRYLPQVPPSYRAITIRELLSHTSGLQKQHYDYLEKLHSFMPYGGSANLISVEEIMNRIFSRDSHPEPGTHFSYSNSGYLLLGKVAEAVTHQSLAQLLKTEIFDPLNMKHSGALTPDLDFPHDVRPDSNIAQYKLLTSNPNVLFAIGGIYSNLEDLYQWERALFGPHNFLSDQAVREMTTEQPMTTKQLTPGCEVGYGFGQHITRIQGKTFVWHTGHVKDHVVMLEHIVDDNISVIVLTNETRSPVRDITNHVLAGLFSLPAIPVPPENIGTKDVPVRRAHAYQRRGRR